MGVRCLCMGIGFMEKSILVDPALIQIFFESNIWIKAGSTKIDFSIKATTKEALEKGHLTYPFWETESGRHCPYHAHIL